MKTIRFVITTVAAAGALLAQVRLDSNKMRNDLFAAMSGDKSALKRMFEASEPVLAQNPDHAQALMWHGVATLGAFFMQAQSGNVQAAFPTLQKATSEMDRAVSLAPDDVEVRVLRAVMYTPASRSMPGPMGTALLEKARDDFQHTFDLERDYLDKIGTHPLGELLQGLGDTNSRLGKTDEAEKYYRLIQTMLKETEYAKRAGEWMTTRQPLPEARTRCVGCHTGR